MSLSIPPSIIWGLAQESYRKLRDWWTRPQKPSKAELEQIALQKRKAAEVAEAARLARRVCEVCKTELADQHNGTFCRCGSSRITTWGELHARKMAEEQRKLREHAEAERQARERIEIEQARQAAARQKELRTAAALERCRMIATVRYCAKCCAERKYAGKCESCGSDLGQIPASVAFWRANSEFPEIIRTEDDYNRLVKKGFWEVVNGN